MKKQTRLAIFISGGGTNAFNLMSRFQNNELIKIALIFSTRPNENIENAAGKFNVAYRQSKENSGEWDNLARKYCDEFNIDFIVLAGFLKKIPTSILEKFPNRIINIHPSLLPKFGGKGMYGKHVHDAVINAGEKTSGITIHFVNEEFDKGKIISQFETKLTENETSDSLAEKIHELEMKYFPVVLEKLFIK